MNAKLANFFWSDNKYLYKNMENSSYVWRIVRNKLKIVHEKNMMFLSCIRIKFIFTYKKTTDHD